MIFTERQERIMALMPYVRFITREQVQGMLGGSIGLVTRHLNPLVENGFIVRHEGVRPHVYRLSRKGCARTGVTFKVAFPSSAMIHKNLLRNKVFIEHGGSAENGRILTIRHLGQDGIYPSPNEFAIELDGKKILLLIDDGQTSPYQFGRSMLREHKPDIRGGIAKGMRWPRYVEDVWIVSIDDRRLKKMLNHVNDFISEHDWLMTMRVRALLYSPIM